MAFPITKKYKESNSFIEIDGAKPYHNRGLIKSPSKTETIIIDNDSQFNSLGRFKKVSIKE